MRLRLRAGRRVPMGLGLETTEPPPSWAGVLLRIRETTPSQFYWCCCFVPLAGSPLTPKDLLAIITTRRPESFFLSMCQLCVCNYGHVKSALRIVSLG
jgi:hypothetical protein